MFLGTALAFYLVAFMGAYVLYSLQLTKGEKVISFILYTPKEPSKLSEGKLFFLSLANALLFCLVGSIVGVLLTQPESYQQALAAGLGWVGLINGAAKVTS